jgi:hypothetical protein
LVPPQVGDAVYRQEDDNPSEASRVPSNQPGRRQGVFTIDTMRFGEVEVRPVIIRGEQVEGEWEILEG